MDDTLTLLVDAPSLYFRALFSTPDNVKAPDGTPINAAHGFLWMLARLVSDHDPDYLACAADLDWRPQWRVDLIDTYKTHRAASGSAQEDAERVLGPQIPIIDGLLDACGIQVVGCPGNEAEDVIATLAARAPGRVDIVSGDRDLFQLVEDPKVRVLFPVRGVSQLDVIDEARITERYGIPGRAYLDFAVLRGDPSDGLPGVRGVGEKIAAGLVTRYGSLDAIIEAARGPTAGQAIAKVRRELDYVERAVQVVSIPSDLPIPEVDLARPRDARDDIIVPAAERMGLGGPVNALIGALRGDAGDAGDVN